MVPLDGGKSQRSRGGGGRAQRAQSMGGALGPAHALVLRVWGALGPPRPAKRRRPPAHPNGDLLPPRQHASVGPTAVARWRPGRPWRSHGGRRRLAAGGGPAGPPPACQTKERGPGPKAPGPLFQGASRPAAAVRKGRWAWPPRRLPSAPLLTGLPPRFFRHWRRSAPAVRKGRCASPLKRLPSTPLLTGLPPRFFRHWRRSAPAVRKGRWAWPPRKSVRKLR